MNQIKVFINECKAELEKVVWPDKEERFGATWVVIVSVFLLTAIIFLIDHFYLFGLGRLTK
ncbi:MAG: preprotein translocase subunit SecE [Candidatus Aureabacteria bacterium]|nr:preprotein translocase subunit SecE [Candidatus Auribacterota bacterium]